MPGDRLRRWLASGERVGFRLLAKLVFVGIVLVLALASVAANSVLLAILAGLAVGLMLRAILPTERFQTWARSLWTGEAGDRWRRRLASVWSRIAGVVPW